MIWKQTVRDWTGKERSLPNKSHRDNDPKNLNDVLAGQIWVHLFPCQALWFPFFFLNDEP